MLTSETHFTKKIYFKIPNYNLFHTMHSDGTAHGGSAILIKSNIKHHEYSAFSSEHIQAIAIEVED